jgi:hypothetical protein
MLKLKKVVNNLVVCNCLINGENRTFISVEEAALISQHLDNGGKIGLNTRYLHQFSDRGAVPGETSIIFQKGDAWRTFIVLES